MKLTRYETIGITTSILVVIVVLGAIRFFPNRDKNIETADSASDIVVVDPNIQDTETALAQAIVEASTDQGRITKLIVYDTAVGNGREARFGDTVTVHYIGLLKDGPEFDNSYKKNQPFSFKVGSGEVIEGWDKGIVGMKEGGDRILIIPASLGYGSEAVNELPPNATLVFSIKLLSIE